jgi:tetratricopeptide (TPR) repeat protein
MIFLPVSMLNFENLNRITKMNNHYTSIFLFIIVGILFNTSSVSAQEAVKTARGEITIPTYPWRGKDDINPSFRQTSDPMYSPYTTTYPYPIQDNLSKTKQNVTYKTMVIENEYLKVIVIPELGGHVHAVYDKLTGESIVYENKVLKPTLIGLRGAWTSGGIEFNTGPQGHTVTCLSPVEANFVDYPDGSKGIAIGNIEQVYQTQWVVTIRLRPGRNFLEEKVRIYNPTEQKRIYYFWNCVAVENTDSSQLIYPMKLGQDHWGKTFYPWPMDKGKDQSWLKNYDVPTGIFAYRCDQDFYGSYDHKLDRGLIAYANHYELEGKKSWTWGKGIWGARFQSCLRDDSSSYNEIQTGPMPTQADYGVLNPHQTVEWQEWWYPVRGTKGVAYSNNDVTVNIVRDEKKRSLVMLINGTGTFDATCTLDGSGEQKISISPDKSNKVVFPFKNLKDTFHIVIQSGTNLLADFRYPLPLADRKIPENPRELPSENTAAGCWLRGRQAWREGGIHAAAEWYTKAIRKDENFFPAMTALAEIYINACQFDTAMIYLEKGVRLNPDDGWAMYYLSIAQLEKGSHMEALELAYHAARCIESSAAAHHLSGMIYMRQGKFREAIIPLRKALDYNAQDLKSRNMLAYCLWKTGNQAAALDELNEVMQRDPLDLYAHAIMQLMGKDDKSFFSMISGRSEEVLDLARFFMEAGLNGEAAGFLKKYYLDIDGKEISPMVYYYYGIITGEKELLNQAAEMNPDYVFPNTQADASILMQAIKINPNDWKAKYYLGNFLFEQGIKEQAEKYWKEAHAIYPGYSVLNRNLGLIAWKVDKNYWQAVSYYEKAIVCNPNDLPLYRDLATIYIENLQEYYKAKVLLESLLQEKKSIRADIISLLTRAYNFMGAYDKSIELLAADSYMNWEGRGSLYTIYTDAHIGNGEQYFNQGKYEEALKEFQLSLEYPTTLGPGLTSEPESARSHFWIGSAFEKLDNKEEADKHWEKAGSQSNSGSQENIKYASQAKEKISAKKPVK